ncbi:hypothetical protein [Aeromicrobium sp. P5_D10]
MAEEEGAAHLAVRVLTLVSRLLFLLNGAAQVFAFVAFALLMLEWWGPWGAAAIGVTLLAYWVFVPRPVLPAALCAKCDHAQEHHHGNCQECLRASVRGDGDALAVPCSKFKRSEAPTPWKTFAASRT